MRFDVYVCPVHGALLLEPNGFGGGRFIGRRCCDKLGENPYIWLDLDAQHAEEVYDATVCDEDEQESQT